MTVTTRRVLFVDHEPRLSGGERNLLDLVAALVDEGVDCHLAVPEDGPLSIAMKEAGATVHIVPMASSLRSVSRWEMAKNPLVLARHVGAISRATVPLARLARSLRPDVVHSNSQKAHVLAVPAAWAARCPLVWHMEDILEPGWLLRVMQVIAAFAPRRVIAISRATASAFDGSRAAKKVRVVYPGVRVDDPLPVEVATWRERLGCRDGGQLVGMVGQIAHWKGQDLFVDAVGQLAQRRPALSFAVVGTCLFPENEARFEADTRARATELGLDARISWTGHVDDIAPVMAAFDVLVHASRLPEPFGRVIVEALAQGTPVVTTTIGAGPELVTPDAGALVPPGDADALAAAIESLLDRTAPEGGDQRQATRGTAERFSPASSARGVLAIYDELGR